MLIDASPTIIEIVDDQGRTALNFLGSEWVERFKALPVIILLIEKGANISENTKITEKFHWWFKPIAESINLIDQILSSEIINNQEIQLVRIVSNFDQIFINRLENELLYKLYEGSDKENTKLILNIGENIKNLQNKQLQDIAYVGTKKAIDKAHKIGAIKYEVNQIIDQNNSDDLLNEINLPHEADKISVDFLGENNC